MPSNLIESEAKKAKHFRPQKDDTVYWWDVKETTKDKLGQRFQQTTADDFRRQGRKDVLHVGAYMGFYPEKWYNLTGQVMNPVPPTPKDLRDGVPKMRLRDLQKGKSPRARQR